MIIVYVFDPKILAGYLPRWSIGIIPPVKTTDEELTIWFPWKSLRRNESVWIVPGTWTE